MNLADNARLYDIAVRTAIYVENVKAWQTLQFNYVLREISEVLEKLLGRVRYKTLDGLSKAQLNKLIAELRESQSKIYSTYTQTLIEQLRAFAAADLEVNRRAWVSAKREEETEEESPRIVSDEEAQAYLLAGLGSGAALFGLAAITGDPARMWATVSKTPIAANGLYLSPFIKTFSTSAQASVENIIRKAWANRWTVQETLSALIGDGERIQGTASQLDRIGQQAAAVIHTSFAHVAALVSAGVTSAVYGKYVWVSVMDNKTTQICISRDGRIYRFGKGPVPPAHVRCRSGIAPIRNANPPPDESFYSWLARQPEIVQDDVLGKSNASVLRKNKLNAKDLTKYENNKQLTLDEFTKKIKQILSR